MTIIAPTPTLVRMPQYRYEDCTVLNWVDGDTLDMQARVTFEHRMVFDPGFKFEVTAAQIVTTQFTGRFRLLHVNAWERREALGPAATAFSAAMMPVGAAICAETKKDPDNFGRYLAELWLPGQPEKTLSAELIQAGLGKPYMMDS